MSELIDTATVLAIKIDKYTNKLFLFDVVDEKYHLIASNETQTTAFAPFNDIQEGIIRSIDSLEKITGRKLVGQNSKLIVPSQPDGSGVDQLIITYGFINHIDVISMGILEEVSLQSAKNLLSMTHLHEIDRISINDPRKFEELMAVFANKKPHLLLLAGGTEQGATRSLSKLVDIILFSLRMLPSDQRPSLIFAGNSNLAKKIETSFSEITKTYIVPNIRPSLEQENLSPALKKIGQITTELLKTSIGGFSTISSMTSSMPIPFSQALGIMTRFLSKLNDGNNTVLTIHVDKESSIMAACEEDRLAINISNEFLNTNLKNVLTPQIISSIQKWSSMYISDDEIKFKLLNKFTQPNSIPTTESDYIVETSHLRFALQTQFTDFLSKNESLSSIFSQIIISGHTFSNQLTTEDSLLLVLNGIQPRGITSIFLDSHGILPALGAIAIENKILPVQIMESTAISLLARVFSIESKARYGTSIAKIKIEYDDGTKSDIVIKKGLLTRLPISSGQYAKIFIQPLRKIIVDPWGRNLSKGFIVQGGLCGVIVDSRGRPISLPKDEARRRDQLKKWRNSLN
ncbi:MAG: hypothetical protein CL609_07130 [Anaerolineaceae bacterium]|nr:hypothetical protein [Anaerolineaceae bacterium]